MMSDGAKKGIRILSQVLRGIIIAFAIMALFLMVMSVLSLVSDNHNRDPRINARTLVSITNLARSIEFFESEYGKLPSAPELDFETEGPQAAKWLTVLLGKEDPEQEMQNPRQIVFLTMRVTKNRKHGDLVISPKNEVVGVYDAWGNPLRVILRPPGKTVNPISYRGKRVTNDQPAVVLSRGKDGKWDTEDDLMSTSDKH